MAICSASLILWLLFLSVKPTTSQQSIENLCAKAIDKNFCLQVLATSPSQSLDDLLKTAVLHALDNAAATSDKIRDLLTKPNNPALTVAYFQCSNYYSAAVGALGAASQRLSSSPATEVAKDVASAASTAEKDADFCEASFKNIGATHPLSSDNRGLKLYSNVIQVVCAAI